MSPHPAALTPARFSARRVFVSACKWVVVVVLFYTAIELLFGRTYRIGPGDLISGLALGSLYGILGVAIILIYRSVKIINLAAGAIGAIPAIFALLLVIQHHVNFLLVLPIALIGGPLFGALTDIVVMRRFARSPRLIATVITIGVAQTLAVPAYFIPIWLGQNATNVGAIIPTPWQNLAWNNGIGQPILTGNEIAAFVAVIALTGGLAAYLRYTRIGIALRASSENRDRAHLLGIPVKRVTTMAWVLAGLLSATAIFFQAPLTGAPSDATLGYDTLLYGLAAAIVARMQSFGVALVAGMGIGVVITSSVIFSGDDSIASGIMLVTILASLLLQRKQMGRGFDSGESNWQTVEHYRPIPVALRKLKEVVIVRQGAAVLAIAVVVALPFALGAGNTPYLILLPLYGIVGVSLVILTGWAGQISLGQFGLVGVAAGVAGGLAANHNIDFFADLAVGIVVGAIAAVIVGLPALRIQGLYLAATTLAFSYAVQNYVLNQHYWIGEHILPSGLSSHLFRPVLYGVINLNSDRAFYFVCLVFLGLSMAAAHSFRRNRSGRILIAVRDNQRAASAYGVNAARSRLAAFAVSGGIAGLAGALFAYAQRGVIPGSYSVQASILVFLAAAVAGVSSLSWTVAGVMTLELSVAFGSRIYDLTGSTNLESVLPLALTGPLLLINMYFYPGGSAQNGFATRDKWLRRLAIRRNIDVPSFLDDPRDEDAERSVIVDAGGSRSKTFVPVDKVTTGQ
jgi:branched-chain amino acid transport system permease protein